MVAEASVITISAVFVYCCIRGTKSTNSSPNMYLVPDWRHSGLSLHWVGVSAIFPFHSV